MAILDNAGGGLSMQRGEREGVEGLVKVLASGYGARRE